jgi:subtilisin family serine protease
MFSLGNVQMGLPLDRLTDHIDYGERLLGIPSHWVLSKGEGIGVAILDTGIDTSHVDLQCNIKLALDFTGSPNGPEDIVGHGTHVAGIIGGNENKSGIIGIAPRCNLYALKVLADDGHGTMAMLNNALVWVLNNHEALGIHVVNMSLGSPSGDRATYQLLCALKDRGVVVLCAAGNAGRAAPGQTTVNYPARWSEGGACISVGAVDAASRSAKFSSTGKGQVTFVGPGVEVISTVPGNQYAKMSGTSMATPALTGMIALMMAAKRLEDSDKDGKVEMDEVVTQLKAICRDLGAVGQDDEYGWGLPVWVD